MQRDYVPLFRTICTSERVASLPNDSARLFYLLLLTQCDSWGRVEDSPATLNALCWPMLEREVFEVEIHLAALDQSGLLRRLSDGEDRWIQVTGWEHRAGRIGHPDRRGPSRWPEEGRSGVVRSTPESAGPIPSEQSRAEQSRSSPSGSGHRSRGGPPRKKPTGPHAELIQFFEQRWRETRGVAYAIQTKDCVAAAAALKLAKGDLALAKARVEAMLSSADAWVAQHASLPLLISQWNAFAVKVVPRPKGALQNLLDGLGGAGGQNGLVTT